MGDIREELRRMARRTMLGQISITDRLVLNIYQRAAEQLARKAAKAGTLDERWLTAYRHTLDETIRGMHDEMMTGVTRGMRETARGAQAVTTEYLKEVFKRAGVSDAFTSTLARVPDEAVKQLIGGKMYKDGRILSKRIWSECGRLEGNIEEILAQGVVQQQSPLQIAKALEAYVNPKARIDYDAAQIYGNPKLTKLMTNGNSHVDFNALRLARTGMTHVQWATRKAMAEKNPLCTAMHWELSPSHFERQVSVFGEDVCDAYARHDEGLGKGNFPLDKLPMPHPMCMCTQWEDVPSLDDAVQRMKRWIDGGDDPELDRGFAGWKNGMKLDNEGGSGTINNVVLHTIKDPMREVTGSALESNPQDVERIIRALEEKKVELIYGKSMAYSPGFSKGSPGQMHIDKDASYSAWLHEYKHVLDDERHGWMGMRSMFENMDRHYRFEVNAYKLEIHRAEKAGRNDIAERLRALLEEERRDIYGERDADIRE